jgi:hypothetical protein
VRHVRIIGVALLAVFAVGALAASPALAAESTQREMEKLFRWCPINAPLPEPVWRDAACVWGEAGKESFFQAGKVTVHFQKPVFLHGGLQENEELGTLRWLASRYGNTITAEAEPAPSLTEGVNAALLPEREKLRYEAYLAKGGSTKVTATIELAKPATGNININEGSLLSETGEAFGFPVMIHLRNGFLGDSCYVGSTIEPIEVPFTTGETSPEPPNTPIHGTLGKITVTGEGRTLDIAGTHLVNNTFAAPGVQGCGKAESTESGPAWGADAAVNSALGLPSPSGSNTTELIGNLAQTGMESAAEFLHFGA